jgi:hypothetical protein
MKHETQPPGEPDPHTTESRSFGGRKLSAEGQISNYDRWLEFLAAEDWATIEPS